MTTQADLIALANKHIDNPGVKVLLTSIKDAQMQAQSRLQSSRLCNANLLAAVSLNPNSASHVSNTMANELAAYAAQAAAYMHIMSSDLMNLACLLEKLGEEISY